MRKRESALRNLLLLIVLLVAAVLFVALLPFVRRPGPVLPPESPEITAKRFAPENAYQTLDAAWKRSPKLAVGQPASAEAREFSRMDWAMKRDPLDELLGTCLPGFLLQPDPQYPMLEKMREALAQPYFLWPVDWADPECKLSAWQANWISRRNPQNPNARRDPFMEAIDRFAQISRISSGRAVAGVRDDADRGVCFAYLVDALHLALLLEEDGDYLWPSMMLFREAVPFTYDVAHEASDAVLLDVFERLAALREKAGSPVANVEFLLRRIDRSRNRNVVKNAGDPEDFFERVVYSIRMRRLRTWIGEHREELERSVTLHYADFRNWQFQARGASGRRHDFTITNFLDEIDRIIQAKAEAGMWLDCAETIIALERYHLKNGTYPENLDALVSEFLKSAPLDIYLGDKPLVYGRVDDNYHLYSVGENRIDNGGMVAFGKNAVGRGEDLVAHWPSGTGPAK